MTQLLLNGIKRLGRDSRHCRDWTASNASGETRDTAGTGRHQTPRARLETLQGLDGIKRVGRDSRHCRHCTASNASGETRDTACRHWKASNASCVARESRVTVARTFLARSGPENIFSLQRVTNISHTLLVIYYLVLYCYYFAQIACYLLFSYLLSLICTNCLLFIVIISHKLVVNYYLVLYCHYFAQIACYLLFCYFLSFFCTNCLLFIILLFIVLISRK